MKRHTIIGRLTSVAALSLGLLVAPSTAFAHCDTLDGPVVAAARKALDSGNVNLILVWVQKKDEGEIRNMFQKAVAVRKAGGQAKELADRTCPDPRRVARACRPRVQARHQHE